VLSPTNVLGEILKVQSLHDIVGTSEDKKNALDTISFAYIVLLDSVILIR
jgi:hypothetical protein